MVQMGRVKRKGRKRDQEGESTQLVESYTQPAGGSFENGERMNGERVSGGVILKGSNHFDDTQLVEDPIDGDGETQLAFCTNSHAYPSIEHDTGIQTQLVDEPENADCLEPRDSENEGTEIIGSPSSEGGSSSCQHFACQDGNTARDVTAYSEGMNALNIDVKITVTSRSLSAHMDKKVADSDASTEDGNNLDSGPPEVNSASVHAIPHKVTSHSPHVERYPKRHVFQADSEKAEVWDRYSGKVEIDNPKVENSVEENTRNTLPSNDAGKIVDDVTSLHVHTIEQPSELKYLCSEEPGELSQANALEVVDKLLGFD